MDVLRGEDRVCIYLYVLRKKFGDEPTAKNTQRAIAEGTGIGRTHISRVLKSLIKKGLVWEKKGRVSGQKRAVKLYGLTQKGVSYADELLGDVGGITIRVVWRGGERDMHLSDVIDVYGVESLGLIEDKVLRISEEFIGREGVIKALHGWLSSNKDFFVLYGGRGTGKTYILKNFVDKVKKKHRIFWISLRDGASLAEVAFAMGMPEGGRDVEEFVRYVRNFPKSSLVVMDNYHEVEDDLVEALAKLAIEGTGGAKFLIAALDSTPYYSRFYDANFNENVEELRLQPFSLEDTLRMLGCDAGNEYGVKIHQISRGKPAAIDALLRNDFARLAELGFSPEEIKLMSFYAKKLKGEL